jgi:hypothetical protein
VTDLSSHCPLWLKLLSAQRARGLTGLTPSFLVGVSQRDYAAVPADSVFVELASLLGSLNVAKSGNCHVVITPCSVHGQPIASLYRPEEEKPICEYVSDHKGKTGVLFASARYFDSKRRSIDSLARGLAKIFGAQMSLGEYSFSLESNEYQAFSAQDLAFIARAQASHKRSSRPRSISKRQSGERRK